ncbi:class E sortase [Streptomyces sp. ERV7]|uniref:class E sortase n=1 Tax=Streptomyces sp. ERV7 TaxID=1322334 RepID=UPI0007F34FED|nr:class E sortase [Streptomyces sp. ERV7]OAR23794.1 class E sortase [Streptomyces sp. ERV7]
MTAVRPEHEYDPLTDPLPAGGHGSPWFRADNIPQEQVQAEPQVQVPGGDPYARVDAYARVAEAAAPPVREWYAEPAADPVPEPLPQPGPVPGTVFEPEPGPDEVSFDDATMALKRIAETPAPPTGGRAERRRAAKARGHRASAASAPAEPAKTGRPPTRAEARRAAKARKDSAAVVASRIIGELFITLGVVMLLFVTYQLWWTNIRAHQQAGSEAKKITHDWASGKKAPGVFAPGKGFAIMHIPKLDVVVPVAEGTNKHKVLDKGMVGHYGQGSLKTAMPGDRTGNFAVAGHRNTHGEPFRYINRLKPGDLVIVETQQAYYTYAITGMLPSTSPKNVSVLKPIPVGAGFTRPGRYLTLTTCTPEFTSTYRMIVWGKMVDERPRSKGLPEALAG